MVADGGTKAGEVMRMHHIHESDAFFIVEGNAVAGVGLGVVGGHVNVVVVVVGVMNHYEISDVEL